MKETTASPEEALPAAAETFRLRGRGRFPLLATFGLLLFNIVAVLPMLIGGLVERNPHEPALPPAGAVEGGPEKCHAVYIPCLRHVRALEGAPKNMLQDTVIKHYFGDADGFPDDMEIYTGENFYDEVKDLLLGNQAQRKSIREFETFLGDTFFDRDRVTLIPREKPKPVLMVKIGTKHDREIHNLGNGIQQLLMLAFPIFKHADKNLALFVDEPELGLHASLQRVFLNLCADYESKGMRQVFMTTHSNHLLDRTLDRTKIAVFTTQAEAHPDAGVNEVDAKFIVRQVSDGEQSLLDALGVLHSSVLTTNCSIWVEGVTDRMYVRKYLDLYVKYLEEKGQTPAKLREDYHYSIPEYGGGNMVHWSFFGETHDEDTLFDVSAITSKMFVILDRDTENKSAPRVETLREHLDEECVEVLPCREIENLLSPRTLAATVSALEKNDDSQITEPKSNEDYVNKGIGTFIDEKMLTQGSSKRGDYKYGKQLTANEKNKKVKLDKTLKDHMKPRFARAACVAMQSHGDMSPSAVELAKKIYYFICKANGLSTDRDEASSGPREPG